MRTGPFKSIKNRLAHYLHVNYGIVVKKPAEENILDKTYKVVKGSVRTNDYDDAWLLALALNSNVVFDIGSNVGQASLLMLYAQNVEEVVLVDPNPLALSIAAENLILNNLSQKARFVCAFVSDCPDLQVEFWTTGCGAAGSMFKKHARTASLLGSSISVATTTVDVLAKRYSVTPELVKIDVEGAEFLVLRGAVGLAQRRETKFVVEMHSNPDLPMLMNAQRVLRWCRESEYRAWYLKDKSELQNPEQIKDRGRCHLLLLPSEMAFPSYLMPLEQGADLRYVKTPRDSGQRNPDTSARTR